MTAAEALDILLFAHVESKERVREAYQKLKEVVDFYESEYEGVNLLQDLKRRGYTMQTLADEIGYSRSYTQACIQAKTGKTDVERRAKELIYGKNKIG